MSKQKSIARKLVESIHAGAKVRSTLGHYSSALQSCSLTTNNYAPSMCFYGHQDRRPKEREEINDILRTQG